ncbi:MAG: hypothetical protein AAGJ37_15475 [Pseudomonadota bacterium]
MNARIITRTVLAGPATLLFAIVALAAMPVWAPAGAAGVNHIVFSLISFPAWWALAFFYSVLEENLVRGSIVMAIAIGLNAYIAYLSGGW